MFFAYSARFNEAAGIPRGRPSTRRCKRFAKSCFNEAAGIPRGRRALNRVVKSCHYSFNEAAGIPRGRLRPGAEEAHEPIRLQ